MARLHLSCNSFASTVVMLSLALLVSGQSKAPALSGRSLFLNGTDISSARNQLLKNVTLRIDEEGNVFIEAPHYNVREESEYLPISKWAGSKHPAHNATVRALPHPQTAGTAAPGAMPITNSSAAGPGAAMPAPGAPTQSAAAVVATGVAPGQPKAGVKASDSSTDRPALDGEMPPGP